jgi:glycosyltransferase involved in cell wall biosynthesis
LLEEHGRFYPETESRVRVAANRLLIRRLTHRFVAVSKDIAARLVRYEGLDPGEVEVIYNGVAPESELSAEERAGLRRELGFAPGDFVVGTVGRFDSIKNLPMLVRSLVATGAAEPSVHGLLVGDGPEMTSIRSMIDQGPMRDRIRLTGYRRDARRLAQCMDLFVLPSFSEGTSMALLEAMAAGVPAVVTEVGGNPEIVLDGITGWTVPSDATDELTRSLLVAARDPDLRIRMASAGRQRFDEHFRMSQMIEAYRQLYAQLREVPVRLATAAG